MGTNGVRTACPLVRRLPAAVGILSTIVMLLGFTVPVYSVEPEIREELVEIDHHAKAVRKIAPGGAVYEIHTFDQFAEGKLPVGYRVSDRERVTIRLEGLNPLLFRYELLREEKSPTRNYLETEKFISALDPLKGILEQDKPETTPEDAVSEILAKTTADQTGLGAVVVQRSQIRTENLNQGLMTTFSNLQGPFVVLPSQKSLDDFITEVVEVLQAAEEIPALVRGSVNDGGLVTAKTTALGWDVVKFESLKKKFAEIDAGRRELLKLYPTQGASLTDRQRYVLDLYSLLADNEDDYTEALRQIKDFREDVKKIGTDLELTVEHDFLFNQPFTVKAIPVDEKQDLWRSWGPKINGSLQFSPDSWADVDYVAGAIYNMAEKVEFKTESAEGGFRIVEEFEDTRGAEGGIFLNIFPEWWNRTSLGVALQVGVGAGNAGPTGYVGGGLVLNRRAFLSAGLALGLTEELRGQAVGDIIERESQLDTDTDLETGLYLGLTFDLFGD